MKGNKYLAEVIHIELRQSDRLVKDYRNSRFKIYIDLISEIIQKGQEQELFRADIMPGIANRALFGALDEVSRVWTEPNSPKYSLEETTDQIISMFLDGLLTQPIAEKSLAAPCIRPSPKR